MGRIQFLAANKDSKARDRADKIVKELRRYRGRPVSLAQLVEVGGPYHLEVHQVLATLESLGAVQRYEEGSSEKGAHRVAYAWVKPTDRRKMTIAA